MVNKKSYTKPSAKPASGSQKPNKQYFGAEAVAETSEKVVNFNNEAVKSFFSTGAGEAQKAQEKIFSLGRESAEQIAKSTDAATKALFEAVSASRENLETCIECSNATAAFAQELSSEVFDSTNRAFSDSVELSKELLACRTLNDMLELNSRAVKNACDSFFEQTSKLSDMVFEYSNEAMEPLNERVSEVARKLGKTLAA